MKKVFVMFVLFLGLLSADEKLFQSVDPSKMILLQKGKAQYYCPNCGMHLPTFYKTSHAVMLQDGSHRHFCSMHCLVDEMEMGFLRDKKKMVRTITVVDTDTLKMIPVKDAFYVVGSSVKGTMTSNSQYAFGTKQGARKFMSLYGGKLYNFEQAYEIALKDFVADIKMLKTKKEDSVYNAGKTILEKFCDPKKIDFHAANIAQLKANIVTSQACKELLEPQLQALALYVWDIKLDKFNANYGQLIH